MPSEAWFRRLRKGTRKQFVVLLYEHQTATKMMETDSERKARLQCDLWVHQHRRAEIYDIPSGKLRYHASWEVSPCKSAVPVFIWPGFNAEEFFPAQIRTIG